MVWDKEIADIRMIHGIGRSPLEIFKSEEEKSLRPLPDKRWEPTTWSQCRVRREWRIMIDCAYYSVPLKRRLNSSNFPRLLIFSVLEKQQDIEHRSRSQLSSYSYF